ncbi:PREDICTED: heat stress transcription factor A-4a-like [Camelina sativa]|uniref:Heat stress transcription factor A-4a-like n=1 Tax=Camelina sativa TaxID=90675 RepID=A0ABM0URG6_CAMSA|nr:PREDICTED: heat stress transcription factor A-4a-like [Camelina sativa]
MAEYLDSFYTCIYEVVNDPSLDSIISWGKSNNSFIIWNSRELSSELLSISRPSRLPCANIKMFFHDLQHYGFKRVKGSPHIEFGNAYFVRGKPELLRKMQQKSFDKNHRKYQAARAKNQAIKDAGEKVPWFQGNKDRVASDDDKRTVRERLCSSGRLDQGRCRDSDRSHDEVSAGIKASRIHQVGDFT